MNDVVRKISVFIFVLGFIWCDSKVKMSKQQINIWHVLSIVYFPRVSKL